MSLSESSDDGSDSDSSSSDSGDSSDDDDGAVTMPLSSSVDKDVCITRTFLKFMYHCTCTFND